MNISIKDLRFAYPNGFAALRGVSLDVAAGEKVAVIGQNGSGKTTLVRHLNGLLKPTSGDVTIGEWNTRDHPVNKLASRVGYVFQNPDEQLFCKSVAEEVAFGPRNLGYDAPKAAQLVQAALEFTQLGQHKGKNPYDLSPTWRKMVAIASVLAMDPPIIILDEPTTGQDPAGVRRIINVVDAAHASGKTVVVITHDMDFCAENFTRVVAISAGMVLADGPTAEVMAQTDLLATTGVEPAQLTRLGQALGLERIVLTQEDLLRELEHRSGGGLGK